MTRRKDVYQGTLEYFIDVLICHVPVFHVLQLHNKLQKIDMSCLANHLDIFLGLI
jgi:energy-converting hydrogenase A subunit M